jgi:site-specific DNA recombinase
MKAPRTATAEHQLLVQFQGMIAEYERAQILERSRRGKLHRARQGQVNLLSGAPYGYRYVRKSDDAAARYEIINTEADIVRALYNHYVVAGMSIGGYHTPAQRTGCADPQTDLALGALHGVGDVT